MVEIKFEAWDVENKKMIPWNLRMFSDMSPVTGYGNEFPTDGSFVLRQSIGLRDENDEEWHWADIGEFENGDRFYIDCEDWLEFFAEWIGEPKEECQIQDFEDIANAKKIGNTFENPEFMEVDGERG